MKSIKFSVIICFLFLLFSCSNPSDMNNTDLGINNNDTISIDQESKAVDENQNNDGEITDINDPNAIFDDVYDNWGELDFSSVNTRASTWVVKAWPIVRKGAESLNVKIIQYLLKAAGYSISIDGQFGSGTESVVKAFQRAKGLSADGIVGSGTWSKLIITIKQGSNGYSVKALQDVLRNRCGYSLTIDGAFGTGTKGKVVQFQSSYALSADGVVGPTTWQYLIAGATKSSNGGGGSSNDFWGSRVSSWTFPVKSSLACNPNTGARYFGAVRNGGARSHAGVDLIPSTGTGTNVYAMTSGTVINYYYFYSGTYALEVKNDDGTVIRYGEITSSLRSGARVSKNQIIGKIIRNTAGGSYMLHLEVYKGTSSGSLTQGANHTYKYVTKRNYQRRSDLIDPMGVTRLSR
ncbi:MAG: hypothetical protein A2086_10690 [Spirochaetes bacterium GWD1_27_9]|nr:MAG: hypothetical protein A2Z98_18395 [Spirochaetes bacterium GWB1_27_13]OHD21457.1 MAG: hypothetical protein A2Y34_01225 [Spirochaetes bacterium GWC1_27_15]OHD35171.1 MAG: hypothetical protein A2086_10690 [Spirochaetes bacterium GWD1_27_9]